MRPKTGNPARETKESRRIRLVLSRIMARKAAQSGSAAQDKEVTGVSQELDPQRF